jgi:hypothetical protein
MLTNGKNSVNRFLMEPLSMIKYTQFCNTPSDIIVYINSKYKKIDGCPINVIINDDIGDSILITWWEPKAEYAGFNTFPEEHKNEQLKKFIEKSIEELEADNDQIIFFDKKFDSTQYSMLDSYEREKMRRSSYRSSISTRFERKGLENFSFFCSLITLFTKPTKSDSDNRIILFISINTNHFKKGAGD